MLKILSLPVFFFLFALLDLSQLIVCTQCGLLLTTKPQTRPHDIVQMKRPRPHVKIMSISVSKLAYYSCYTINYYK